MDGNKFQGRENSIYQETSVAIVAERKEQKGVLESEAGEVGWD